MVDTVLLVSTIHPSASDANFEELRQDPFFEVARDLAADYLADAFDDPAAGEVDRWTLSALPSTNHTPDRHRLFTLNVGPMEVLYIERFLEAGEIVDYRVALYLSRSALLGETGLNLDGLAMRYPLLRFHDTTMASVEGDGVVVDWFVSDDGADDQFFDLPLEQAIRPLVDRLVAKGRGPYAQFHNRAFAAAVLAGGDR